SLVSTSVTIIPRPRATALAPAIRSASGAVSREDFSGFCGETSQITRSSPSRSWAVSATWAWPSWAGLKEPPNSPTRMPGASQKPGRRTWGKGRFGARPAFHIRLRPARSRGIAVEVRIRLPDPGAHGEHPVARQHRAAGEQPPVLPVGKAELGLVQRVLAVHPTGEAVAHEGRVDGGPEAVLLGGGLVDQAGGELRAVAVKEGDGPVEVGDDFQPDLGA